MVWNVSVPADSDLASLGAGVIRTLKTDVQTALDAEGVFPGASPAVPVFRWKPRVGNTASQPANDPVNPGTMYFNTDIQAWQMDNGTAWVTFANPIFPGALEFSARPDVPAGWLLCNGAAVSRTTFAALFAAIGTAHGSGDGSTTFNLPDYRGQFLRMVDGGAGRDPNTSTRTAMAPGGNTGDAVGSIQGGATAPNGLAAVDPGHTHPRSNATPPISVDSTGSTRVDIYGGSGAGNLTGGATTGITFSGDQETRPTNAYANILIKT
jgi:microcystin-dependent protein